MGFSSGKTPAMTSSIPIWSSTRHTSIIPCHDCFKTSFSTDWCLKLAFHRNILQSKQADFHILNSQEHNCLSLFLVLLVFLMNARNVQYHQHFNISSKTCFPMICPGTPFSIARQISTVWNSSPASLARFTLASASGCWSFFQGNWSSTSTSSPMITDHRFPLPSKSQSYQRH